MRPPDRLPSRRDPHRTTRVLACLAASLALANAAFWWPHTSAPRAPRTMTLPTPAPVELVPIPPTRLPEAPPSLPPPPPPPDLPPEEVPDEVVIRETMPRLPAPPPLDDRPLTVSPSAPTAGPTAPVGPPAPGAPAPPPGAPPPRTAASERIVERPARSPRPTRIPLPVYPEAARRDGIRARVRVRVLVAETGGVLSAEVVGREVLDRRDQPTAVPSLPHGMDDAALAAARTVRFVPAQDDGERVRAPTVITLSFDPARD